MKLIIMLNDYGFRLFITRQWIGFQLLSGSRIHTKTTYLLYPEIWRDKGR